MTTEEYRNLIAVYDRGRLLELWDKICARDTPGWAPGKALEFLILRAFELEGAEIRWPFSVRMTEDDEEVEQIDGLIHFPDSDISVMVECKDWDNARASGKISIDPIAKLRNQLMRRPSNLVGAVFTTSEFSGPALVLAQFLAPQTVILWERLDIDYCLRNSSFLSGFKRKYRHALEEGFPNLTLTMEDIAI